MDETVAVPDPIVERFKPEGRLVVRAHRDMLESEDQARRFIRQRWEQAFGAARVSLDCLREIWPVDRSSLSEGEAALVRTATDLATQLVEELDELRRGMLGDAMAGVLSGAILTHEELDNFIGVETPPTLHRKLLRYLCENPGQLPPDYVPETAEELEELDAALAPLREAGWIEMRGIHPIATAKAMDAYPRFDGLDD